MTDEKQEAEPSLAPDSYLSTGMEKLLLRFHPNLTQEQIWETCGKVSNRKAITALALAGLIDERLFLRYVAASLEIRLVDLRDREDCDPDRVAFLMMDLPPDFALRNRLVPLLITQDEIIVAFADPLDTHAVQDLQLLMQMRVYVSLASETDILNLLLHKTDGKRDFPTENSELALDNDTVEFVSSDNAAVNTDENAIRSAPVVQLVNKVFADAIQSETSDIHFEPSQEGLDIKFRIDGVLTTKHSISREMQAHATSRIKLLSGMDITERRRPQDGRLSVKVSAGDPVDMRVSSVPTPAGEKLVIRLLTGNPAAKDMQSLGLSAPMEKQMESILGVTDGIVLVTGPTGSGKTTTLYTCLYHVMKGGRHAITVEDPIEFRIPGVTQIQVDRKINMTFAAGLRSILRQDPDVILLGEVRDIETAETAFHAAQTGHLVMTTLHTNDAPSAVTRLLDMGLDPTVIASSLRGVLAQRLVRRICQTCSRPLTPYEMESAVANLGKDIDVSNMRIGNGCRRCNSTGLRGRIGVYSLLTLDGDVRAAVRDNLGEDMIVDVAREHGFKSMQETGIELVLAGETTVQEISRVLGTLQPTMRKVGEETDLLAMSGLHSIKKKKKKQDRGTQVLNAGEVDVDSLESTSLLDLAHGKAEESRNRILLVDDDPKIRSIMAQALRGSNFEVTEASNGAEALGMISSVSPTIVVCDLVMPEVDGRSFVNSLRSEGQFNHIPVLMLTSEDAEGLEAELLEAGANDFVHKTSSIKTILSRVRKLIRGTHYPKMELTLE